MALLTLMLLLPLCAAQQPGTLKSEGSPTMTVKECSKGQCTTKEHKLVLDANWRWIHTTEGYRNCYDGNEWDTSICADPEACAKDCALEAVDDRQYERIYGITPVPGGVRLNFVTGSNVGSRLFLLEDDDNYKLFMLKNREFAMDVDSSAVECGMNGAMYFIEMAADGGKGIGHNAAGAKYGTGYCDAQCPHDVKFIDGKANSKNWKPHPKDFSNTMGLGHYGACCAEMDIWEANNMATAYTPHPCDIDSPGQYMCSGTECGDNDSGERYDGVCDKDGCDINPFRNQNTTFYGPGADFAVDSSRPMTVVTQFLTTDGTDAGDLSEIRRFYVQDGRAVASPSITILPKAPGYPDSITDQSCKDMKDLFDNENDFQEKGGNKAMGESLSRGHVAAFSLWDDIDVHMMWLDSCYPEDRECSEPGIRRGMCPGGEDSSPRNVRRKHPRGYVTFANVAIGEIGSTQSVYPGATGPVPPTASTTTTTTTTSKVATVKPTTTAAATTTQPSCAKAWQQCGGRNHNGPTCCAEGWSCVVDNEWYSQCKPGTDAAFAQASKRKERRQKFLGPSFMQSKTKITASAQVFDSWEL
ncbi:cbhB [Symbiodinium sp. CCMP2592]|nr:cbhB [Symbiodinium sp. CCMP2592]